MQKWDLVVIIALLVTCVWAPYEVALIEVDLNASFVCNQLVNFIFLLDICLTFFVPYFVGNSLITSHRLIARRYLRSWFVIDIISCIPFEVVTLAFSDVPSAALKPFKMLRLLRLLKLARIAKASRILSRWENHITMPYSERALIMWSLVLLLMLHWFSCAWCMTALVYGSLRTPELQAALPSVNVSGGCTGCRGMAVERCPSDCLTDCEVRTLAALEGVGAERILNKETWICRTVRDGVLSPNSVVKFPFEVYSVPLSGMGFIGITYQHGNFAERIVYFVLYFLSQVVWSMFVGAICGAIANTDPFTKQYRAVMEQLNHFLRENDAPLDFRLRAREYVRSSRDVRKKNAFPQLFAELSPTLRNEAAAVCSAATLKNVSVLSSIESECIMRLAQHLTYRGVAVSETITPGGDSLMIVTYGVAASGGKILTEGMSFGEDMILNSQLLKRFPRPVIALTYLELAVLTHDHLFDTLHDFPRSHQNVRIAANLIALQRFGAVLKRANDAKKKTGSDLDEKDVELLLKTISGRTKLRTVDMKRHQIAENERPMLSSRTMWVHQLNERMRRTETRMDTVHSLMHEMRDTLHSQAKQAAVSGGDSVQESAAEGVPADAASTEELDGNLTERAERRAAFQNKDRPAREVINRSHKKKKKNFAADAQVSFCAKDTSTTRTSTPRVLESAIVQAPPMARNGSGPAAHLVVATASSCAAAPATANADGEETTADALTA